MNVIHFRDMPAEPTECEVLAAWTEPTEEDLAGIQEYFEACRRVAELNAFRSGSLDLGGDQTVATRRPQ